MTTSRNRILIGAVVVIALSLLGYWGYQNYLAPLPATPTAGAQAALDSGPVVISAEGRVVPVQFANLSFGGPGLVAQIWVEEGQSVEAGESLARLDTWAQAEANLAAAEVQRVSAQQAYDELFDGLDLARSLAQQSVANGRDFVRDAEQRLTNLGSPSKQTDIDQAQSNVVLAQDRLDRAQDAFAPYENKPEDNVIRAALQSQLAQAQAEYDAAVRLLNNLKGTASDIDLAQAQADLEVARALLADAERNYADLRDGLADDALELAQAQLWNAEAHYAAANDALVKQELRAPFAGTVVRLDLKVGEFVAPGAPAIALADLTAWRIETTDLAEGDVALLQAGYAATITLDAFPGAEFEGMVTEIGWVGEDRRGQIVYPVSLSFDPGDTPVRWGMTAFVDIQLPEADN